MIREFEIYPPDVGSITAHRCGCLTWLSSGEFCILACSGACPSMLAMTELARSEGKPVDIRPAWSW